VVLRTNRVADRSMSCVMVYYDIICRNRSMTTDDLIGLHEFRLAGSSTGIRCLGRLYMILDSTSQSSWFFAC